MEIKKSKSGNNVTLELWGRLDTVTSSMLSDELAKVFNEKVENLIFDFEKLEYISSAGLRVLLMTQKKINELEKTMKIINVNEDVKEVFDITGFSGVLTIV